MGVTVGSPTAKNHAQLADMGIKHFFHLDKDPSVANISEILQIAGSMHRFVEDDDVENLNAHVSLGEVEAVLKWFKKDKIPGPNG